MMVFDDDLVQSRRDRLLEAVEAAPFDAFVAVSNANVAHASGYRSVAAEIFGRQALRAVVTPDRVVVVGLCADGGPALEAGIVPDDFVPYGRFYFTSHEGHPASEFADQHADVDDALAEALRRAGVLGGRLGVDDSAGVDLRGTLQAVAPDADVTSASDWAYAVRAKKLPAEIARLREAARLAESGIDAALDVAEEGMTEREIAAVVADTMVAGGGHPRFIVATAGERSALADAHVSDRPWKGGELLRFDVGCTIDGYWSDMARTAVLGEPDATQVSRYDALLAGEQAELDRIRPGVPARELFDIAMDTVRRRGLPGYRRHHCGHGIGSEVYEPPIVSPDFDTEVEAGMTFCLETPYYEMEWGGMMVEDTIVVTEDGYERLTVSDRSLRVVGV
ncbi:M24 family metallopeptidase [Euzebya tangerina]|uniref:M24 family metallopeptidase n=1 Tax=Euzebya tangerina TaxID=591198 RepID=UPI000E31000B|nr:Xaa-Pro peptidase family protein [Euzebya tangerina]